MPSTSPTATLSTLCVSKHMVPSHKRLPNSSILNKPLLIYHSVFSKPSAPAIESHLKSVGVVEPQWRYTMYPTSHFHSNTHEVLCVCSGSARLCFGGEDNPGRVEPVVQAGDVIILPAGMAHRLLDDTSTGGSRFEMVGSYPKGYDWDMCYGRKGEERQVDGIGSVPWFDNDPIYGNQGPVLKA
ncbi:cupin domain-containing protein [Diaporthe helianthi]|uniref:Cupin domain-containing protein n=1 Tax=Diaporthe helianthi TaxID=158607 RepID=A0A2P5HUY0_DIAHE|nr:cupin domain-containing protein [Diaporthe helianthi]